MNRSQTIAVTAIVVLLNTVVAGQFGYIVWTSIQLSFADEQTMIFTEMVESTSEALRRKPPDMETAVDCLDYIRNYYPSGTTQTTGSRLDRIVERSRVSAESQVFEMIRISTDTELDTSPEASIRSFLNQTASEE
jgi:hypothetical protein